MRRMQICGFLGQFRSPSLTNWTQKNDAEKRGEKIAFRANPQVVKDAASPGETVQWTALLSGGTILDINFWKSAGQQGVSFQHPRATSHKRWFLVAPDFQLAEPALSNVIKVAVQAAGSKWVLLSSWTEFSHQFEKLSGPDVPAKRRRPMDVLALTTARTQAALNLKCVLSKTDCKNFLSHVSCAKQGFCDS